jgi:hypothetical protein
MHVRWRKVRRVVRLEEVLVALLSLPGRKGHAEALVNAINVAKPQPPRSGTVRIGTNVN